MRRQRANGRRCVPALAMQIDAEASQPGRRSETSAEPSLRYRSQRLRMQQGKHRGFDRVAFERRFRHRRHDAVQPNGGREAGHEKQIGRASRDQLAQPVLERIDSVHAGSTLTANVTLRTTHALGFGLWTVSAPSGDLTRALDAGFKVRLDVRFGAVGGLVVVCANRAGRKELPEASDTVD